MCCVYPIQLVDRIGDVQIVIDNNRRIDIHVHLYFGFVESFIITNAVVIMFTHETVCYMCQIVDSVRRE